MPITIGTNIVSLIAQRQLGNAAREQSSVMERLSSGMRINKASDDAAGLSVATSLSNKSRLLNRSLLNVNDGISMLNVVSGSLEAISDIVIRMQELATQAANGVYSTQQRAALQKESDSLSQEYSRIVESTSFNGRQLLKANSPSIGLHVGTESSDLISFNLGAYFSRTIGDGTFQTGVTLFGSGGANDLKAGDFNGDGIADFITSGTTGSRIAVYLGNGDGTFSRAEYDAGNSWDISLGDLNNDGIQDIVTTHAGWDRITILFGNANGSFSAPTQIQAMSTGLGSATIGDFDGDGNMDIATVNEANNQFIILRGNGNGTFKPITSHASAFQTEGVEAVDLNGDGFDDLIVRANNWSSDTVQIWISNGDGTFRHQQNLANQSHGDFFGPIVGDIDHDGDMDFITNHYNGSEWVARTFINNGQGNFTVGQELRGANRTNSLVDLNGDGHLDYLGSNYSGGGVSISYGNGDGTFKAGVTFMGVDKAIAADFDGDGAIDLAGNPGTGGIRFYKANSTKTTSLPYFDIKTQAAAKETMSILSSAATRINQERGSIGAFMSRLSSTASYIQQQRLEFTAAASRIVDNDIAADTATLIRTKILQQTGVAVLAQANLQPQLVLQLLGVENSKK